MTPLAWFLLIVVGLTFGSAADLTLRRRYDVAAVVLGCTNLAALTYFVEKYLA